MIKKTLVLLFFSSLVNCQRKEEVKIDGSSKANFEKSYELILDKKNQYQIKLFNEAISIIENNAYSVNFTNVPDKKVFSKNYDVLKKINGLTYEETIKLAEKVLEKEKSQAIEDLTKHIEFMEIKKFNNINNQKKINSTFKITDFKLTFDKEEKKPQLEIEFTYIGNEKLTKYIDLILQIKEQRSKESIEENYQFLLDKTPLIYGKKLNASISLEKYKNLFSTTKFPIMNPNMATYGVEFEYYFETVFINDDLYIGRGYGYGVTEYYIEGEKKKLEEIKAIKTKLE